MAKRGSISSEPPANAEPSTWKVLVSLGTAGWITYSLWSSASYIFRWLQNKIQLHNLKKAVAEVERQQKGTLQKRQTSKVTPLRRPSTWVMVNVTVGKTEVSC